MSATYTKAQMDNARREADEARYEVDELLRQRDREAELRAERRRQEMRDQMPSNRLYRGEISNTREAIEAHIAALRHEAARDYAPEPPDSDAPDALKEEVPWPKWIAEAEECLREYDDAVGSAERALAERWKVAPEGSYRHTIGHAIDDRDFSILAI